MENIKLYKKTNLQLVGVKLTSSPVSLASDSSFGVPHLKHWSLRLKLFTPHWCSMQNNQLIFSKDNQTNTTL